MTALWPRHRKLKMIEGTTLETGLSSERAGTSTLKSQFRVFALAEAWKAILPPVVPVAASDRAQKVRAALKAIKEGRKTTRSGRPLGRPRRLTTKKIKRISELRERGIPWGKVAQLVGLPKGTCRNAALSTSNKGRSPDAVSVSFLEGEACQAAPELSQERLLRRD